MSSSAWFRQAVELPPDAIAIARRLSDREGVVLARARRGSVAYVACDPCAESQALDPEPSRARVASELGELPRWFGYVPYDAVREASLEPDERAEALISRPLWLRYRALVRIDKRVEVIAESAEAGRALLDALSRAEPAARASVTLAEPLEQASLHRARIEQALVEIARGSIYEVNLARRFVLSVTGSATELLGALEASVPLPHAFALEHAGTSIAAASPELCLLLEPDGRIVTEPIKGTRPRHPDPARDRALADELERDPKERAELTMILDVERNDFGRVALTGSVRLLRAPEVVALPHVHHRLAAIEARIAPECSREALLRAVLPSGSVTGAPKRRAMQLIAELEPHRRGLYTGAVGFVRHDGGLELGMAIRTLTARGGVGHYFAGGGIVADSQPEREVLETLWKAARLLELAGQAAPST